MVKTARSGGFIMQRDEGGKGDKSSILGEREILCINVGAWRGLAWTLAQNASLPFAR